MQWIICLRMQSNTHLSGNKSHATGFTSEETYIRLHSQKTLFVCLCANHFVNFFVEKRTINVLNKTNINHTFLIICDPNVTCARVHQYVLIELPVGRIINKIMKGSHKSEASTPRDSLLPVYTNYTSRLCPVKRNHPDQRFRQKHRKWNTLKRVIFLTIFFSPQGKFPKPGSLFVQRYQNLVGLCHFWMLSPTVWCMIYSKEDELPLTNRGPTWQLNIWARRSWKKHCWQGSWLTCPQAKDYPYMLPNHQAPLCSHPHPQGNLYIRHQQTQGGHP